MALSETEELELLELEKEKYDDSPSSVLTEYVEPEKKPLSEDEIKLLVKAQIDNLPIPKTQKIVERIVEKIEVKEKEDKKDYAEKESVNSLKKEIKDLKKLIDNIQEILPLIGIGAKGGSGVLGLPSPQDHSGQFLTTDGNAFSWATVTASSSSDPLYIGDPNTDGSWRFTTSLAETAGTLEVQKRIAGVWTKSAFWEQP